MRLLFCGEPFGVSGDPREILAGSRHELRTLGAGGGADYAFAPEEDIHAVLARTGDWRPELLVVWLPESYPPPRAIETAPMPSIAVISDWNLHAPALHHNLARYDAVLCDKPGARLLRLSGARPQYSGPIYAHHPLRHRNLGIERDIDVAFAGNLNGAIHPKRGRLLERVAGLAETGRRTAVVSGIWGEDYVRLLNRARIVFNHSVRGEANLRCFEAAACGAMLLCEAENEELPEVFQPGIASAAYREEDLLDCIAHYLEHAPLRAEIAASGEARAAALLPGPRFDALIEAADPFAASGVRAFGGYDGPVQCAAELMQYSRSLVPGQRTWAACAAQEAARNWPDAPEVLSAAAIASLGAPEAGSAGGALQWLTRAVEGAPDDAALWYNLGYVCASAGQPEAALPCLAQARKARGLAHARFLIGGFADPGHVDWLRRVATGEAVPAALHALADALEERIAPGAAAQ